MSLVHLLRAGLALAALDALASGLWLALRPGDLLHLLQATDSPDARLLARGLGVVTLSYLAFLLPVVVQPGADRGLLAAPLLGRAVQAGLWLWLLATPRLTLPAGPLALLFAHDAVWLLMVGRNCRRRPGIP
jgi:hypothetical protein